MQKVNQICAMDSPWTAKVVLTKPCIHKVKDDKTPSGYCEIFQKACTYPYAEESGCKEYDMGAEKDISAEEFYKLSETRKFCFYPGS